MTTTALQLKQKTEEFNTVFKEQFPLVYSFMKYRTNSVIDAEDMTAEVFARAYRYWDSYSPPKGSRGEWIGGIARNTYKTHVAKKAQGLKTTELYEFIPSDADIERDYLRKEILQQVFMQIDVLPEHQRKIIRMKFYMSFSNKDIAQAMDMSVSNVGVTLHRIVKKIKLNLQNAGYEESI
ncbi:MAG: sigma-70 family RNA polymerase sigma factor [Clostridiales bacterium]|nr:sigma-70 family RNA polymerase sigma factor [Clostridiales bacterium]